MESKYYVSIAIENNQYIGRVYLTNNNQLVYTTQPYGSQEQATTDVRSFVIKSASNSSPETPQPPKTLYSTASYTTPVTPVRRCCGR
jgi:hypothetical protein